MRATPAIHERENAYGFAILCKIDYKSQYIQSYITYGSLKYPNHCKGKQQFISRLKPVRNITINLLNTFNIILYFYINLITRTTILPFNVST